MLAAMRTCARAPCGVLVMKGRALSVPMNRFLVGTSSGHKVCPLHTYEVVSFGVAFDKKQFLSPGMQLHCISETIGPRYTGLM